MDYIVCDQLLKVSQFLDNFLDTTMDFFKSNSQLIYAIYTDFEKPFDKINHTLLMHKLETVGILNPLLSWFN